MTSPDFTRLPVPSAYAEPDFTDEPATVDLRHGLIVENSIGVWTYLPQSNGDDRRWVSVDTGGRYRGESTETLIAKGKSTILFSGVGPVRDTIIIQP